MRITFIEDNPSGNPEGADSGPPQKTTKTKTKTRKTAAEPPLFSIQNIPGKGRGLIASRDIPQGARIISEKPLFLIDSSSTEDLERDLIRKVNALQPAERANFLALHDNFPDSLGFSTIFKTNALPCGHGSTAAGVYPTICLINHSCLPNTHHCWNSATRQETVHATRPINAGEEITITYIEPSALSSTRLERLQLSFGFRCQCPICSLPKDALKANDERRAMMELLDTLIVSAALPNPARAFRACHDLHVAMHEEYQGCPGILAGRLYYDAFQICAADGDRERAKIFAEKTYASRLMCEGTDSEDVKVMTPYMEDPLNFHSFGMLANPATKRRWHTKPPSSEDTVKFEEWLWREDKK